MSRTFNLPDLGEGLPEAEIVSWHVQPGDTVRADDLLVTVETAKAVVEVPSPFSGTVRRLHAGEGEVVETGRPLVEFSDGDAANDGEAAEEPTDTAEPEAPEPDSGASVVGAVPDGGDALPAENARAGSRRRREAGRAKAAPAARALARELGVNLDEISPSGDAGQILPEDVRAHHKVLRGAGTAETTPAGGGGPLRGMRRTMAQNMAAARDQVAACTVFDDADIHAWREPRAITERLLRAMVAGCRAQPRLNGFFHPETETHEVADRIDIAVAMDTTDGLFVPVLRDLGELDTAQLRERLDQLKRAGRERAIKPGDMRGHTITLSNFGMLAGRYATPVLLPPNVAILACGALQHDVVAVLGGIEVHRRLPLSLTFDHRCVTGSEACRFLAAVTEDLARID